MHVSSVTIFTIILQVFHTRHTMADKSVLTLTWHSKPHTPCSQFSPSLWGGSPSPVGGSSGWSECYGQCNTSSPSRSSPVTSPGGGETHHCTQRKMLKGHQDIKYHCFYSLNARNFNETIINVVTDSCILKNAIEIILFLNICFN